MINQNPGNSASSSFARFETRGDERSYLHSHGEVELIYFESGWGVRAIGNEHQAFGPGELAIIPAGTPHCWLPALGSNELNAFVIQFKPDLFDNFPECKTLKGLYDPGKRGCLFSLIPENLQRSVEQAVTEGGISSLFKLLASLFMIQALDANPLSARDLIDPTPNDRVETVTSAMFSSFPRGSGLEEAAAAAGMSAPAFSRWFHKEFGRTYLDYLNDLRIQHAISLLRHTKRSVSDIARSSGFEHDSTFNRVFRKYAGSNPLSFR